MSEELTYIIRVAGLILKQHRGELDEDESLELKVWCAQSQQNQALFDRLSKGDFIRSGIRELPDVHSLKKEGWDRLMAEIGDEMVDHRGLSGVIRPWKKYAIAAVVLGVLCIGGWIYRRGAASKPENQPMISHIGNDVSPGRNRAVLMLADGSRIDLDSTGKVSIPSQAGRRISNEAGILSYTSVAGTIENSSGTQGEERGHRGAGTANTPGAAANTLAARTTNTSAVGTANTSAARTAGGNVTAFNMLTTPAAGQYRVILPDGSRVWLNNASSLRYPLTFSGGRREVELDGEAYFEIAKNPAQPFTVKVGGLSVDVLGTSFNINAYFNEGRLLTTLLSGGVRVRRGSETVVLEPGEQALAGQTGAIELKKEIDTDGAVAWKNGYFHFDKSDVQSVMRQLSRWYDVDVVYEGSIPVRVFGGEIQRDLSLKQVLEMLERQKLHFDLQGRKLTVRP